jgi:hypothetical protein
MKNGRKILLSLNFILHPSSFHQLPTFAKNQPDDYDSGLLLVGEIINRN